MKDLIHIDGLKCPSCKKERFYKYIQTSGETIGESAVRCMNQNCTLDAHKVTARCIEMDYKDPTKEHFEFKNSIEKYDFYIQLMEIL